MDSFTRKYLMVLGSAALVGLLWWALGGDARVDELNDRLAGDHELTEYPYPFRVLRLENGVAIMSSPRSAEVSVIQFLRLAFPELHNEPIDGAAVTAAQKALAAKQSRAAELVRGEDGISGVRWELDRRWLEERGAVLPL